MKHIYSLVISFLFITVSFAQTNTVVASGLWDNVNTWSLKRLPANGDKVEVPAGKTLEVAGNTNLSASNMEINVFGTLVLNNGKLALGNNSKVIIQEKAKLVTTKGTPADKINIGNTDKYTGAEGTLTGFLLASNTTGVSPNGFLKAMPVILPVKFASFDVALKNNGVQVQWSTAEEVSADYFEVERSNGNNSWTALGRVKAKGNSTSLVHYSFTDKSAVAGTVYYRIKQADVDGKATYTTIKSVTNHNNAAITITGYNSQVALQFAKEVKGKVDVLVVNRAGQIMARQTLNNPVGHVTLNTASLKGAYFVTIQAAGQSASQQVVL